MAPRDPELCSRPVSGTEIQNCLVGAASERGGEEQASGCRTALWLRCCPGPRTPGFRAPLGPPTEPPAERKRGDAKETHPALRLQCHCHRESASQALLARKWEGARSARASRGAEADTGQHRAPNGAGTSKGPQGAQSGASAEGVGLREGSCAATNPPLDPLLPAFLIKRNCSLDPTRSCGRDPWPP